MDGEGIGTSESKPEGCADGWADPARRAQGLEVNVAQVAEKISRTAHADRTDRAGAPYIQHSARVAAKLHRYGDFACATAWLQDVLECTDVTVDLLHESAIPRPVIDAVLLLTRKQGVTSAHYYDQIASSVLARRVKLTAIADDADPRRLAKLAPRTQVRLLAEYSCALTLLAGRL